MKTMKTMALLSLALVLLLSGCATQTPSSIGNIQGTVENIFTIPSTTATDSTSTDPTDTAPTEPTNPNSVGLGGMSFGIDCERQHDEKGHYLVYEGGQMHLPYKVNTSGIISEYDVGILLFVDGVAQPYRVSPDGEYAYMHVFSQKDGAQILGTTTTIADMYFTPIVGKEGDMLEIYALCMPNPNYVPSQGLGPFSQTAGAVLSQTRLKYNATPPDDTYPEKSTRLLDVGISVVDCTAEDVENWTDKDMITNQRIAFTANGVRSYVYGVTADTQITLRFEVWGSPYVHYGLIFFVDNEPVYTADLSDIWVRVEMGKKTVIEATLDMTGFSGESAVYPMLVARNDYTSEIETIAGFCEGPTIYMLAKEKGG